MSPTHSYTTAGSYTATLTVTASGGGTATATASVTITATPAPVAVAGGPYTGVVGTAVSFSGANSTSPTGQTLSYAWNFGDSSTGTGVGPTHSYTTAGSYTATLTVTASGGGTATATAAVTVTAVPVPVASVGGPYTGVVGTAVSFSGSGSTAPTGQTLSYAWNFGDNSTGTGVNPTHTYLTAGSFTATLTVTASGGGTATATAAVTITSASVSVASAGGPYTGVAGTTVTFDGSKSTAPTGQTLSYAWNFGDNSTGTGVSPTHSYTAAGSFTVILAVTASGGGTATSTAAVTITSAPVSVASAGGPYTGVAGMAVSFDGSKSIAPAGQTLSYSWNFGDSSTGAGVNPTHSYSTAGTYTVTLTVTANGGSTATATAAVTITATPIPVASVGGPYTGVVGTAVSFDGSKSTAPTGQTLSYSWNFGDNSTGTGASPTHAYATQGSFTVTLTVTASGGGTATSTATVTISATPVPVASAGGPYSGVVGTAVSFSGSASTAPTGQTLSYSWNFGDSSTGTGVSPTHAYTTASSFTVTLTVTASGGGTATSTATVTIAAVQTVPTISSFTPASGSIGTLVTLTGTNLTQSNGAGPQVTLSQQGGGTLSAPVSSFGASSLTFVIPAGAATGAVIVTVGSQSATSTSAFTVTTSSSFTVNLSPSTANLIQGQTTTLAVTVNSQNAFSGLANLAVGGLPSGVTASFQPSSVAVGQIAILTLSAPAGQATGASKLSISATATIDTQSVTQSAAASLNVTGITTTFLGRTVVDDATETPIGGVAVTFLGKDSSGRTTGCSGQTTSDGSGNFSLTNLSAACTGPQLIAYDGSTATSPSGKFAGVNLSYTLTASQVTAAPVLIHLPRIDNAETVQVQQNAATDQIFYFHSIPGVKVTVYAGTTISLDDGSQPNPFPLVALSIPLDRLPERMATTGMLMPFIVAFQPANAVSSQPVAVNFPNSLNVAPGTTVTFMTLDPTRGYMVPYGTGTVSSDGSQFIADADPTHPGHAYGLVHFDWHGPSAQAPATTNPSPESGIAPPPPQAPCPACPTSSPPAPTSGEPVDLASGIVSYSSRDVGFGGARGGLSIHRVYRTLTTNAGPFGIGTGHEYEYVLNTQAFILTFLNYTGAASNMTLITPDGNQFSFAQIPDGSFVNSTIPSLKGSVLTFSGTAPLINCTLRWANGTKYTFTSYTSGTAYLTSIVDLNGNITTITRNQSQPAQITSVTDPVGRSLALLYDTSNRITQITDPIGRKVGYTYNSAGTLATFTDQAGGVTKYTYDSSNNLATVVDPRGVTTEQNTYNESFDGRVTKQVLADGGVIHFAYTLQNPNVATSPVLQAVVTDPLGKQTTYRFDMQGFLQSATDASGQTRTLTRDPVHNNLVSEYTGNGTCPVCGDPALGDVHYTYDGFGNLLTKIDSMGNKTTFGYDTRFNFVNTVTDALGNTTAIKYDANGDPISVTDANGHSSQMVYDSFGEPTQTTDQTGAVTKIAYDSYGNVNSVTNALGNITNFAFDGVSRLTQVQDALGRHGQTAYDALDRVTKVTDPLNNATQLTYDAVGDLLSLTDPKGNVTSFTYDSRQRLQTRADPLKRAQSYQYDTDSNLTQFTDRRGQMSKFAYDAVNRLATATYQDSTVANTYDAAGRLLSVVDSMDGEFGYKYDTAGQLLQQSEPTGVVRYTRDALGRNVTKQVVGQAATNYTYDAVGNVLTAALPNAGVTFTYDQRDLPTTLSRTNGVVSTYSYDSIGELLSLVHANGATVLNAQVYQYDKVGKRTAVQNDLSQPLVTQSATYSTNADNQLVSSNTSAYTYDENGNRLTETSSAGKVTYAWDSRQRLSSTTNADGSTVALHYDYGRNLLELDRNSGAGTTVQRFVVDSITNVVSLTDSTGLLASVLTSGSLDSHLASVDANGNAAFGIGDALESNLAITNTAGQLGNKLSYEPYGQTTGVALAQFPFAYTGRVQLNTNVYYLRNRFLDTGVGSFISEDPAGLSFGGTSLYEYASDDPINDNDPTGLASSNLSRFVRRFIKKAKIAGLDEAEDKDIDFGVDKVADLASCLTGNGIVGASIKEGYSGYGYVKSVVELAEASAILGLSVATGPVGFFLAASVEALAIYHVYDSFEDLKDKSGELGAAIGRHRRGEDTPACLCSKE